MRGAITLERPPRVDFGDYSTNAALLLAPAGGAPPRELAQRLGDALAARLGEQLERYEVAGPGFLNLFLSDGWHCAALAEVLAAGESFGRSGAEAPERIIVEFVSANPTGPMHVGHARNAAYGDALARVLAFHGHRWSASSMSTTPARRCASWASRSPRWRVAGRSPRTAIAATTCGELAAGLVNARAMPTGRARPARRST